MSIGPPADLNDRRRRQFLASELGVTICRRILDEKSEPMWDAVRLDASRYDRDLEVHSMTRPALNQLILAIENGLTLRDGEVGLDALDGACQRAIDFARQQEIRIFFSDGTLKFVAGSESGESIKTRKGIFRMFCARLAVLGAGEQDLPPLYGGPLRFPGVTGTLVNTPGQQAVTLYPIR